MNDHVIKESERRMDPRNERRLSYLPSDGNYHDHRDRLLMMVTGYYHYGALSFLPRDLLRQAGNNVA